MIFFSSRDKQHKAIFQDAIFQGLSPDGGLYCPESFPDLSSVFQSLSKETSFNTMSKMVLSGFFGDSLSQDTIDNIVDRAFYFTPKIHRLSDNISILELFHGPSCAFKDFGASFLASAMEEFLGSRDKKALILTATSGDTGSAVAQAFYGKKNIDVAVLYPSGRVSPLQEKQLTTLGGNIHALEVQGSFDDCQKMVKEAFIDKNLNTEFNLTSANSINLGRLLPQSLYYIWSWAQMKDHNITFCVPSGNFGNLTAGLYAYHWGLPVNQFIAATNANDVVPEFLETGIYQPRPSIATYSNAMDVGAPSNFERMEVLYNNDPDAFRNDITGYKITDEETILSIQNVYKEYGYLSCPHTAVGIEAAKRQLNQHPDNDIVVLSTAHPGKFIEVVKDATGKEPQLPEALSSLMKKEKKSTVISNTKESLSEFIRNNY